MLFQTIERAVNPLKWSTRTRQRVGGLLMASVTVAGGAASACGPPAGSTTADPWHFGGAGLGYGEHPPTSDKPTPPSAGDRCVTVGSSGLRHGISTIVIGAGNQEEVANANGIQDKNAEVGAGRRITIPKDVIETYLEGNVKEADSTIAPGAC